jgi:protein-tyrosine phosphatase
MDDGSSSVEMSMAMLRMEADQGVRTIVATPHFYPQSDTPSHFLDKRNCAYEQLRTEMAKENGLPLIRLGAEVYFFRGMNQSETLDQLTIANKKYILVEMPMTPWTDEMYRELEDIHRNRGITPVVAHIDRYVRPFRSHGIIKKLAELPVLVQANAEYFQRKRTACMAMHLLKTDHIHLLGSDCHDVSTRKPNLGDAIRRINRGLGDDALLRIQNYESKILDA